MERGIARIPTAFVQFTKTAWAVSFPYGPALPLSTTPWRGIRRRQAPSHPGSPARSRRSPGGQRRNREDQPYKLVIPTAPRRRDSGGKIPDEGALAALRTLT